MFPNLKAELARIGKNQNYISEILRISKSTTHEKMTGKKEFKLGECKTIKRNVAPNKTLDYLFTTYESDE